MTSHQMYEELKAAQECISRLDENSYNTHIFKAQLAALKSRSLTMLLNDYYIPHLNRKLELEKRKKAESTVDPNAETREIQTAEILALTG